MESFDEVKDDLKQTLDFLSTCKNLDHYLLDGKLTLTNLFQSFFFSVPKYIYGEIGISRTAAQKIHEKVKKSLASKEEDELLFYISKNFKEYFKEGIGDEEFIDKLNKKRSLKGLELISLG